MQHLQSNTSLLIISLGYASAALFARAQDIKSCAWSKHSQYIDTV